MPTLALPQRGLGYWQIVMLHGGAMSRVRASMHMATLCTTQARVAAWGLHPSRSCVRGHWHSML